MYSLLSVHEIAEIFLRYKKIQTDSRKVVEGEIFWALKGDNFNGNEFAYDAIERGATYAVVDEVIKPHPRLVLVKDTLEMLHDLALYYRQSFNIPFIALTGSNGKTTTKELIYQVLKTQYRVAATEGNLNNHIGIPLTMLKIPVDAEMAIIEMGANHQGEIGAYCRYVLPNYGIITNCGKAHIGLFGGIEGVRKGKGELFDFLEGVPNGFVFVNGDDDFLVGKSAKIGRVFTYGIKKDCNLKGEVIENQNFIKIKLYYQDQQFVIQSQLVGEYNVTNILCAVAVGLHFNIKLSHIIGGIEGYRPTNSRSQWVEYQGSNVILDAYNANPTSMEVAIKNFAKLPYENKILLLGEMKELGEYAQEEHQKLVDMIGMYAWRSVILVGEGFMNTRHQFLCFGSVGEAKACFKALIVKGSTILIKGSRATKMEEFLA